ncbi:DUF2480 family protein [soil metagenome]
MEPIVNRVAESDIALFDLSAVWDGRPIDLFDIEPFLVQGLILREVPFREALKQYDWEQHRDHHVAVFCSADAIVPTWAYMLIASKLEGIATSVAFGDEAAVRRDYFARALDQVDWSVYAAKPVVIKGCGNALVPQNAYLTATQKLQGVAGKLMFGEPCSSVPIWRRPKPKAPEARAAKPVVLPGR